MHSTTQFFMTRSQLLASSNYTPFFLEIKSFKPKKHTWRFLQAEQGTLSHNSRRCNVCRLPNTKKHTWRFLTDFTGWLWSRQLKLSDIHCSKEMVYNNSLWTGPFGVWFKEDAIQKWDLMNTQPCLMGIFG
jgi:hypothetical protein